MNVVARVILICLIVLGIFAGQSSAKFDTNAIVGMWLFDEGSGKTVKDSSDNGHDGEIIGDVEWVKGKFDNALEFPGTDGNYVTVPHEDSLTLTAFTIAAWVKQQAPEAGVWPTFVDKMSAGIHNFC